MAKSVIPKSLASDVNTLNNDLTSLIKSMNYTATTRADGLVSLPGNAPNGIRYFVFIRNTTDGAYNATLVNGSRYEYSPWIKVTDNRDGSAVANTKIDFVLYYILQQTTI